MGKALERKIDASIKRMQMYEPKEGFFLAFSGGKDSQCVFELAKMAGVKFDPHYHVTGVDPPELFRFIRQQYPETKFDFPAGSDGKRITMWKLIENSSMPPTAITRYCCEKLKEPNGTGRLVMTGVRWDESVRRRNITGVVTVQRPGKTIKRLLDEMEVDYSNAKGGLILNLDNSLERRVVEMCYRTSKTILNPIVDWYEDEVWRFLNEVAKVPHCSLYDEGFHRIGCIGCPMQGPKGMARDFERYPKFKDLYIKAFDRMIQRNQGRCIWKNGQECFDWWIREEQKNGSKAL